jgi:DNA processing protein
MELKELLDTVTVSPFEELLAYEYLYSQNGTTLNSITRNTVHANRLPSEVMKECTGFIKPDELSVVEDYLQSKKGFSVAINTTPSYPTKLMVSKRPTPLFYYRGDLGLLEARSVSIVGARKASNDGIARAKRLGRELAEREIVVVSGLARGIDTAALESAISQKGKVIGVIGTPIDEYYPKENKLLQDTIARAHLLASQVPFYRYAHQSFKSKRLYFPERNELMAAISDATIIVEASDTSGTLTQARACLAQGRPLFILRSCFENSGVSWPSRFLSGNPQCVTVIETTEQIVEKLWGNDTSEQ